VEGRLKRDHLRLILASILILIQQPLVPFGRIRTSGPGGAAGDGGSDRDARAGDGGPGPSADRDGRERGRSPPTERRCVGIGGATNGGGGIGRTGQRSRLGCHRLLEGVNDCRLLATTLQAHRGISSISSSRLGCGLGAGSRNRSGCGPLYKGRI